MERLVHEWFLATLPLMSWRGFFYEEEQSFVGGPGRLGMRVGDQVTVRLA